MKSVEPSVKEVTFIQTKMGMWAGIEYAARVCYNSLDSMKLSGSEEWVRKTIIPKGHGRALEFGSVYLRIPFWRIFTILKYRLNHYTRVKHWNCVTTNYRVIHENGWDGDLKWWNFSKYHAIRRTLQWTISRGIADEFRTHCSISSLMASTRYILYTKQRNGGEITFIRPTWYKDGKDMLNKAWSIAENCYVGLVGDGKQAQQAREVLPLSIKVEFVQCAFEDDWDRFFGLRAEDTEHNHPHPDALYIASKARDLLFGNKQAKKKIAA